MTNIGNEALENVSITDEDLNIYDFEPVGLDGEGMLRKNETVIIKHADAGLNTVEELYDPLVCEIGGDPFENIVVVVSDSSESSAQPTDDDSAWFDCDEPRNICNPDGTGRPSVLFMEYNGTPTGSNAQGDVQGTFMNGHSDYSEVAYINVSDGKKDGAAFSKNFDLAETVIVDRTLNSTGKDPWIPPTVRVEFRTIDDEVVQWIEFHGSCSLPLVVGDEYAGVTLVDFKP